MTVAEGTGAVQSVAPAAAAPAAPAASDSGDGQPVEAAMPGSVVAVEVEVGDTVNEGDTVLVIEAMKMESPVKATASGKVISIEVAAGDTVASGDVLMYIG